MSGVYRPNRKATDEEIIQLNSVGLSLSSIAKLMDCHPSTITIRLKALGISPADTRRTFMEDIFMSLPPKQQDWLVKQLGPQISIKDYMRNLIVKEFLAKSGETDVKPKSKKTPG